MPRNSSGNYSLPAGNPVVPNTLIETTWANPTMSDLGSALTDSLDRFGRGGMLAQLKLADGTAVQPAFAFNSESSTGLYRPSSGVLNVAILGVLVGSFTAAGLAVTGVLSATSISAPSLAISGNATIGGTLGVTGLTSLVNAAVSGTLGVTGLTSLVNAAISGTLGVTGLLTSATHTNTGNATVGGTFGVTGLTSLVDLTTTGNTILGNAVGDTLNVANGSLQVSAAGFVGVGVAPGNLFQANTATAGAKVGKFANTGAASTFTALELTNQTDADFLVSISGVGAATKFASIGPSVAIPFIFKVTNAEKMQLDTSGNLGVGSAPLFTSAGRTVITVNGSASSVLGLGVGGTGVGSLYADSGTSAWSHSTGTLQLAAANITRVFIDASGNVNVGPLTPSVLAGIGPSFQVKGSSGALAGYIGTISSAADSWAGIYSGINLADNPAFAWNVTGDMRFATTTGFGVAGFVERFRMLKDGRFYGTALHNNAGAVTGTANQYIASGTWTPTAGTFTNITTCVPQKAQWLRVGNVVHCSGVVSVDPASASAPVSFRLTLPIATASITGFEMGGAAVRNGASAPSLAASVQLASNQAQFDFTCDASALNQLWTYTFSYEIT